MGASKGILFALSLCFCGLLLLYTTKEKNSMFKKPKNPMFKKPKNPMFKKPKNPIFKKPKNPIFKKPKNPIFKEPPFELSHEQNKQKRVININGITTAANMSVSVVNPQTQVAVGEILSIKIVARDAYSRPKRYGGDFLLAKLCTESPIEACMAGRITDYGNGTYTAQFLLNWPGVSSVSVLLIHPSEAVQVLRRIRDSFSDRRVTYCKFEDKKLNLSEWTRCSFDPNHDINPQSICDYSNPLPNSTWVCEKPKGFTCNSMEACRHNVEAEKPMIERMFTASETQLFDRTHVNQKIPGDLRIFVRDKGSNYHSSAGLLPRCGPHMPEAISEGYWYNGTWISLRCRSLKFSTHMAHNCLKNKVIFIIGDSTGRQYRDYFIDILKGNLVIINDGMRNQENIFNSTGLHFRLHAYPSAHDSMHARNLKYTAEIIDSIVGGPNVVVILSIWAHYTALPLETFTSRVYGIRHAIERLQRRNPGTKVVWRTSNMRGHANLGHFVQNSNWYAYQFVLAAKRILSDLDIFIMDVWDMSVCTKYIIHPEPHVIKNHIDLILSYMCPQ